jgi:hypothetical protein
LIKRAAAAEISPEMTEPDHCSQNRPRGQICSDLLALALSYPMLYTFASGAGCAASVLRGIWRAMNIVATIEANGHQRDSVLPGREAAEGASARAAITRLISSERRAIRGDHRRRRAAISVRVPVRALKGHGLGSYRRKRSESCASTAALAYRCAVDRSG